MASLIRSSAVFKCMMDGELCYKVSVGLVLAGITILFTTFTRYCIWRRNFCQTVPGCQPRFFNPLGNLYATVLQKPPGCRYNFETYMMKEFEGFSKLFQKEKLFCYWVFFCPLVFIVNAEAVEEIVKGSKFNDKAWFYKWFHPFIGTGVLTSSGCKWKSRRKLLTPCFRYNALKDFMPIMDEQSRVLVNRLRQETDKDFSDISTPLSLCSIDIICETILGVRMDAQTNSENSKVVLSLNRAYQLILRRIRKAYQWPDLIYGFTKDGKDMRKQIRIWKDFTLGILRKKKNKYLSGDSSIGDGMRRSLMDLLLEHHLQTKDFSEDDIREEVDTFTLAGSDTTANSLNWTLYLLGLHPDIQSKVHEELDSIFGGDVDSIACETDLNDMKYLECVIKESQRIYPPIPSFARQLTEDIDLCGSRIREGSSCLVFTYAIHRDEKVFKNAEKFDPDRFLPENSINRHPHAYIPFSAGPRNCIGIQFAKIELKIILSNILRNYTVESLDPRDKVLPRFNIFLRPSIPIRMRIRSRHQ